jgi:hypothetical protein
MLEIDIFEVLIFPAFCAFNQDRIAMQTEGEIRAATDELLRRHQAIFQVWLNARNSAVQNENSRLSRAGINETSEERADRFFNRSA